MFAINNNLRINTETTLGQNDDWNLIDLNGPISKPGDEWNLLDLKEPTTNKPDEPSKLGFGLSEISPTAFVSPSLTVEELERKKFCEQVYCTLHSLIQGYTDVQTLKRDIYNDTGIDAFEMARKFGFPTFTDFLQSEYMQKFVNVTKTASGERCFVAAEMPKFQHIRKEQIESLKNSTREKTRREGIFDSRRMRQKMLQVTSINDPTFATLSFQSINNCPPPFSAVSLGRKGKEAMKEATLKVDWDLENEEEYGLKDNNEDISSLKDNNEDIWGLEDNNEDIRGLEDNNEDICGLEDNNEDICGLEDNNEDICGLEDNNEDICGLEDYDIPKEEDNICGLEEMPVGHFHCKKTNRSAPPGHFAKHFQLNFY